MIKISEFLSIKEAAELLGVTPATLRNWEKLQKIKAYRNPMNSYRLYKRGDLEALLSAIQQEDIFINDCIDREKDHYEEPEELVEPEEYQGS